jgi:ribosomal protein L40E/membrane associated rhomboid family serine protease
MSSKSRDLWSATLVGVVVTGTLTALLEAAGLTPPISDAAGAFVGGAAAAYFLYGKVSQATAAGALSGVLGTPFYLGVSEILFIFGVIPTPSSPTPPLSELQIAVVIIIAIDLVAGVFGGAVVGGIRHPHEEAVVTQPQATATPLTQTRYCIQCGAQLPSGAVVCPHCNARQP